MKTIVGVLILFMPIIGCANNDKILDSQEELDTKMDSVLALLSAPVPVIRKDLIVAKFDSIVAYRYDTAQVPTRLNAEEGESIEVRYTEYWIFFANKSESYDGDYEFISYILPGGFQDLKDFEPDYGPDPFDRLTHPNIYQSSGKWRILNEREIDIYRETAVFFSFREYQWYNLPSVILGANIFSFHNTQLMLGSHEGGSEFFKVTNFFNLTSIKNGVFDRT